MSNLKKHSINFWENPTLSYYNFDLNPIQPHKNLTSTTNLLLFLFSRWFGTITTLLSPQKSYVGHFPVYITFFLLTFTYADTWSINLTVWGCFALQMIFDTTQIKISKRSNLTNVTSCFFYTSCTNTNSKIHWSNSEGWSLPSCQLRWRNSPVRESSMRPVPSSRSREPVSETETRTPWEIRQKWKTMKTAAFKECERRGKSKPATTRAGRGGHRAWSCSERLLLQPASAASTKASTLPSYSPLPSLFTAPLTNVLLFFYQIDI